MRKRNSCGLPGNAILLAFLLCGHAQAQSETPRWELGLQLTGLHLHKIDEAPLGIGVRLNYNVKRYATFDAEAVHYPQGRSGHFGETTGLAGIKLGKRSAKAGLFVKGRLGLIRFGGTFFDVRLDRKGHFEVDLGTVVEYYPPRHTVVRIDAGDTIIYFGAAHLRPSPIPLGTVHNFQPALGFGIRF